MPPVARWVRATVARVFDQGDTTTLLAPDGVARRLDGDSAHLARAVLKFLAVPRTRDELLAHLGELAGEPITDATVVDELLSVLRASGAVRDATASATTHSHNHAPLAPARVVLCVTGAVWAVNVPALVTALQRRGCEVRVALTPSARKFVAAPALEALTHATVYKHLFRGDARCPVPHINLAEWANAVVVCPASATTLSRIARGDCSELVSAIAVATRAPVLLVPSMNPAMYAAPSVQRNLATLRDDGFALVHPTLGVEVAHRPDERTAVFGPAPPPDDVAAILATLLASRPRTPPPIAWDAVYRATPPAELAWHTDAPEADVLDALARFAPAQGRFLDIGTGEGTTAAWAAARGYGVVATDVSTAALELAQARASGALFVRDDITATDLRGVFNVVHDRACLHTLAPARRADYLAAVARLTRPDGCLVVKVHSPEATLRGTHPMTAGDLVALFAPAFACVHHAPSTVAGPAGGQPAVLAVFRRLTPKGGRS